VDYIRSAGADAVIMGSSADRGIARAMLAATGGVIRSAGIPIFVCPERSASSRDHRIRRIMVAIDASDPSRSAVERAIAIARRTGAQIEFANVQERDAERCCKDRIASIVACEQAAQAGVHADAIVLHGPTAEALTAAALSNGADLIVVGTHGRSGRARLRYGSVAEDVARGGAECPVMVVPCGPPAAAVRLENAASA
jgi:nucleotide-binding universal stress UspA family protein